MIFPIELDRETIQVWLAFQQNLANFDFNCEYLENASSSRLLIWCHYSYSLYMYLKCGLLTGSGSSNSYAKRFLIIFA